MQTRRRSQPPAKHPHALRRPCPHHAPPPAPAQPPKVRVWWPPTRDKNRTGFSGAFWPAAVVARGKSHFTVRYDNEDEERVNCENIFPFEVPVDFGREVEELQVRARGGGGFF